MSESLKLINIHGVATVWPGKVNVIAVGVKINEYSVEKMLARKFDPAKKPNPGAQQLLFGAFVDPDGLPEISVFQIGPLEPDLYAIPEVHEAIGECLFALIEKLKVP